MGSAKGTNTVSALVILVALFLAPFNADAEPHKQAGDENAAENAGPIFTFVHLTDTHCLTTKANREKPPGDPFGKFGYIKLIHWKDLANSFQILEGAVRHINEKIKPDFVIHTGDITDNGNLTDLIKSKRILDKLKCPYHACQGDHEAKKTKGVYNYVKVFKKRSGSFNVKGWHFIMMGIYPDDKELKWLERDLSRNRNKHVVFFTHRPVVADPILLTGFKMGGIPCLMPEAEKVKKLLVKHGNVALVLTGHVHMNFNIKTVLRGIHHTAFVSTDALGETPHQFKVIKVYEDHVEMVLHTGLSAKNIEHDKWTSQTVSTPDFLKKALTSTK